jgi:hypothetical protein
VCHQVIIVLRKTIFSRPKALFEYLPPAADEWEVPRAKLTIKEAIGEGQYGKVFVGVVTGGIREFPNRVTVAVKQSRLQISLADIKDFFAEVEIMKKFSKPHHRNVRCTLVVKPLLCV